MHTQQQNGARFRFKGQLYQAHKGRAYRISSGFVQAVFACPECDAVSTDIRQVHKCMRQHLRPSRLTRRPVAYTLTAARRRDKAQPITFRITLDTSAAKEQLKQFTLKQHTHITI